ncbi:MAG: PilZ domain-containing protein [Pseudomonadota bacterium]|nr:PilZ domain-containing protein [Pseudomonadota bacterium]
MHELRSAILAGEGASARLVSTKEKCRRRTSNGSLAGLYISREERRSTDQRREDRHFGIVERAIVTFRGKKLLVKVINLSPSGMMIESDVMPHIGETVDVEFDGFDRLQGVVRWVKQGRIGIDVGDGGIALE